MNSYVIVGNSAAAIGCVEGIRLTDKESIVTIVSDEPYLTYSRPLISYWLEGKVKDENMCYRSETFYGDYNINALLGKKVTSITDHKVKMDNGTEIGFTKLLVATGSKPFVPPIEGLDEVKNKFTFMKWDSAKDIKNCIKDLPEPRVLILGAGLIGLKAAEALSHMNAKITVADLANRILPSILDARASEIMQKHIESKGIVFKLGASAEKFTENEAHFKDESIVAFDLVIIAVGVRPNTELVKEAGGEVGAGIITDNHQLTTLPDIYAAGDCTQSFDISSGKEKVLALLPNAYMQGEIAGKNMAGNTAEYLNAIPMNAIGFFGLHIITAGENSDDQEAEYDIFAYEPELPENAGGKECEPIYKKLLVKNGQLKGYILIGDIARAGIYTSLIKEQIPVEQVDFELLKMKPQMMVFAKERRREKLSRQTPYVD
jgi:NAD(P)H-nitrite reductase large subunit